MKKAALNLAGVHVVTQHRRQHVSVSSVETGGAMEKKDRPEWNDGPISRQESPAWVFKHRCAECALRPVAYFR